MRATGTSPTATFLQVGTALANHPTYIDTTVNVSLPYQYQVIAWNAAGSSTSNTITVTTPAPPAPLAPTALTATLQSSTRVLLAWTNNAATNLTGFIVQRSRNGAAFTTLAPVAVAPVGTVNYTDTTVVAGNTYAYQVIALNGPSSSTPSNIATVSDIIPAVPTGLTVTATVATTTTATTRLTWSSVTGATSYTIQRATNAAFTIGLTTTTVNAPAVTFQQNVNRATTYYYRIRAVNIVGASAYSTGVSILTP